jgi:hypothetical protein
MQIMRFRITYSAVYASIPNRWLLGYGFTGSSTIHSHAKPPPCFTGLMFATQTFVLATKLSHISRMSNKILYHRLRRYKYHSQQSVTNEAYSLECLHI